MSTAAAALLAAGMRLAASHDVDLPGRGLLRAGAATWDGYADGAPPGFSGGFREDSCQACHFHEPPNAPPGTLTVEGVPATFAAGQRYALTISLRRDDMKLAGFQLTARVKDSGAQAGTITAGPADSDRVKIESSGGVQYAGHRRRGSTLTDGGIARWVVEWTAPSSGGAVIFHVAANAADGDERVDGDFIYTASLESSAAPPR